VKLPLEVTKFALVGIGYPLVVGGPGGRVYDSAMERIRTRTLVPLMASLLLAAACDGATDGQSNSAASSPTPTTTPTCPNHDAVVSDASLARSGSLTGDVDGDGSEDEIRLATDEDGSEGCRDFVIVDTGDALHAVGILQATLPPELNFPQLRTLAQIDGRPGLEVVVDLGVGASTQFAGAFTMGAGRLERLKLTVDVVAGGQHLFAYGGSVGHLSGVDCVDGNGIVSTIATPDGNRYFAMRVFLVFERGAFRPADTKEARALFEELPERFPELSGTPFASCPSA